MDGFSWQCGCPRDTGSSAAKVRAARPFIEISTPTGDVPRRPRAQSSIDLVQLPRPGSVDAAVRKQRHQRLLGHRRRPRRQRGRTRLRPPLRPTLGASACSGSTRISLSWTASTDNVGVADTGSERCQGAGCPSFIEISTPTGTTSPTPGSRRRLCHSWAASGQPMRPASLQKRLLGRRVGHDSNGRQRLRPAA